MVCGAQAVHLKYRRGGGSRAPEYSVARGRDLLKHSRDTSSEITKKTCALAVYGACSLLLSVLSKPLSQFSLCDLPFPRVCITSLLGQMAAAEYRQLEVGSCLS